MAGVNKVILLGNLGKDPEVRSFEGGRKVAKFSLATTESYKDREGNRVENTEWHSIEFWGPVVDVIERYLKKGSSVYVEGKLRSRSYDDKDGVKRYVTEIVGSQLTLVGGKPNENGSSPVQSAAQSTPQVPAEVIMTDPIPTALSSDVDDLPF